MKAKSSWMRALCLFIAVVLSLPLLGLAQQEGSAAPKTLSKAGTGTASGPHRPLPR